MKKVCSVLAGLLALVSVPAVAQETTGAIAGRVVDSTGLALPGATVTATGAQGAKTVASDAEGRYRIPFLTPGMYVIDSVLDGFEPIHQTGIEVRLGQTFDLSLTMLIGELSETVQVAARSSNVDATSAAIGATLNNDTLSRLPIGRRFSDTLYLAPGVSTGGAVGTANPSVEGASGLENQYVIDGVNVTNGGYGALGSYSIVFGSLGNGTPYDFIEQVQVKTGGYGAEFGQATGGVVNVVTKSGANDIRGSAFAYVRPHVFESTYQTVQSTEGTVNTTGSSLGDAGAAIGGPVVRNRLFYFGAVDPQWQTTTLVAPDGFPLHGLGAVDRNRRIINYAGKGTWQMDSAHRVDVSVFGDPARGDNGPQRSSSLLAQTPSAYSALTYGGHNQTVHYNGVITPHLLIEASAGHALNRIVETPSLNEWRVLDERETPRITSGGVGFYEAGNDSDSWQAQAKATHLFAAVGAHQLRYGVDYEDLRFSQLQQFTGPTFVTPDGRRTATGATVDIIPDPVYGQIYHVGAASLTSARATSQRYTSLFVEDEWKLGASLTVHPGLRYEQETLSGSLVQDFALKNNWAPRIGVVWDPTGSGNSRVFANYGRYYARVPNDLAARALSSDAAITADYFDAGLTTPVPDGVITTNALTGAPTTTHYTLLGAGSDEIDPNARLSYYNEWLAGGEITVRHGLDVGVRFIHRDIGRVLEDVQAYPIVAASAGLPGAATANYLLTNPGPGTPVVQDIPGYAVSFEPPVHNYNAVEVTANRRLNDRWSLTSSYRWSRLTGNYEGFFRNDNGQSDPGITSLYDYPTADPSYTGIGVPVFGYSGDIRFLGAAGEGPLPLDRTHDIKVFATYGFKMGINLSVGVDAQSGAPLTAFAAHPIYGGGGEIPLSVRGAGFDTSDGFRTRTPWTKPVNAGVSYDVKMASPSLTFLADVFNLLNTQTVLDYDSFSELRFNVPNPDFGRAGVSGVAPGQQLAAPRQIRIGVRFSL